MIREITKKKANKNLTLYIGNGNTKHQNYIEIIIILKTSFFFKKSIGKIHL